MAERLELLVQPVIVASPFSLGKVSVTPRVDSLAHDRGFCQALQYREHEATKDEADDAEQVEPGTS